MDEILSMFARSELRRTVWSLAFRFQLWATHRRSERVEKATRDPSPPSSWWLVAVWHSRPPVQFELASSLWVLGGYLCPGHARTHPHPPSFTVTHSTPSLSAISLAWASVFSLSLHPIPRVFQGSTWLNFFLAKPPSAISIALSSGISTSYAPDLPSTTPNLLLPAIPLNPLGLLLGRLHYGASPP